MSVLINSHGKKEYEVISMNWRDSQIKGYYKPLKKKKKKRKFVVDIQRGGLQRGYM